MRLTVIRIVAPKNVIHPASCCVAPARLTRTKAKSTIRTGPTVCIHAPHITFTKLCWAKLACSGRFAPGGGPLLIAKEATSRRTPQTPHNPPKTQPAFEFIILLIWHRLEVVDTDLHVCLSIRELKRSRRKLWRSKMALGIVRGTHPLTGNTHEVGVQLSVGILVVKDRDCIRSGRNALELASRVPSHNFRFGVSNSLICLLWKISGRR